MDPFRYTLVMVVLHGPGGSKVHPRVDCHTMEGLVMQLKTCCLKGEGGGGEIMSVLMKKETTLELLYR